jgi:hypothetical protein
MEFQNLGPMVSLAEAAILIQDLVEKTITFDDGPLVEDESKIRVRLLRCRVVAIEMEKQRDCRVAAFTVRVGVHPYPPNEVQMLTLQTVMGLLDWIGMQQARERAMALRAQQSGLGLVTALPMGAVPVQPLGPTRIR